ncbi:hypothetical protein R1sor_023766 [Riccia sorocarpa]|uniref:Uncharacterized protein n=1 Tax=Riccia sorocarpa TaxID=122646 RepID=A0ABD3GRT4_9MARC
MDKPSFVRLLAEVEGGLRKQNTHWRQPVPARVRLGVILNRLDSNDTYFSIGEKFGIGKTRVHDICQEERGYHSIQFQAIVDADGVFLDVFARMPGTCNDLRVLRCSMWHDHRSFGEVLARLPISTKELDKALFAPGLGFYLVETKLSLHVPEETRVFCHRGPKN